MIYVLHCFQQNIGYNFEDPVHEAIEEAEQGPEI